MSISQDQEVAARIFLRSYSEALQTLKEAAYRDKQHEHYVSFLDRVINAKKSGHFKGTSLQPGSDLKEREVRLFQFSHYLFLKNFPGYDNYHGDFSKFKQMLEKGLQALKQQSL